jgi:hypothetical protein
MDSDNDSRFQPTFHSQRGGFNPSLEALAVFLLLAAALLQSLAAIRLNTNLQAGDQGAYLHLSLAQSEGRKLTDGNRHPLYSALLLPVAERDARFFARARWVSCAIGMTLMVTVAWLEWKRRKDPLSAVVALAFLAAHVQMLRTLSEIWCEPLLYLLVFLLWWKTDAWGPAQGEGAENTSSRFLILAGILAGLLYLTKGTGLQVAVLLFVTLLVFSRNRKKVLLPIALFLILVSPLLLWNLSVYGDPLYSFASTHNMWFDEADEIWYENKDELPTAGSYLQSHSTIEILERLGRGVFLETRMAWQLLWTDWRLPASEASPPISAVIIFFKILSVLFVLYVLALTLRRKPKPLRIASNAGWTFFALMTAVFFLAFGWYAQLTNEPRFLMTLVPITAVLGGRFISKGAHSLGRTSPRLPQVLRSILLVYALLVLIWSAAFAWRTRDVPGPALSPLAERVLNRLHGLPEDSKIAFGPSHGLPVWLARGDLVWRPTPWRIDQDRFLAMLAREEVGYVLVDSETVARRPYLEDLSRPGAAETLGWRLLFRDRDDTNFFLMYEAGVSSGGGYPTP